MSFATELRILLLVYVDPSCLLKNIKQTIKSKCKINNTGKNTGLTKIKICLRILRELQQLSQSELAELTGICQSNISALENGSRQLGRKRALVLAKALKVHPAVLLFPGYDINQTA